MCVNMLYLQQQMNKLCRKLSDDDVEKKEEKKHILII